MIINDDFQFDHRWLDFFLHQLPHRQKAIIEETMFSNKKLHHLATRFNLSESRICVLRKLAINNLKFLMEAAQKKK